MFKPRSRDRIYKRGVGLLVVATVVALLVLLRVYQQGVGPLMGTFHLIATVARVDGLELDATVTAAGLKVGKVRAIELLPDRQLRIHMEVEGKLRNLLRQDSHATLTKPLFGNTILDISLGSPGQPPLSDGASIEIVRVPNINDVVATLPARLERVDAALSNIVAITADLRSTTRRLATAGGPLESTLIDAQASARNTAAATASLGTTLTQLRDVIKSAASTVDQANGALTEIRAGTARVGPIIEKLDQTMENARNLSSDLRAASPQVAPAIEAGQNALQEAQDVLQAAKGSVLLHGNTPLRAPAPTLITPRAP